MRFDHGTGAALAQQGDELLSSIEEIRRIVSEKRKEFDAEEYPEAVEFCDSLLSDIDRLKGERCTANHPYGGRCKRAKGHEGVHRR